MTIIYRINQSTNKLFNEACVLTFIDSKEVFFSIVQAVYWSEAGLKWSHQLNVRDSR